MDVMQKHFLENNEIVECHFCGYSSEFKKIFQHFYNAHRWFSDDSRKHPCFLSGCQSTKYNFSSLKNHILTHNSKSISTSTIDIQPQNIVKKTEKSILNTSKIVEIFDNAISKYFLKCYFFNNKMMNDLKLMLQEIFATIGNFELLQVIDLCKSFSNKNIEINEKIKLPTNVEIFPRTKMKPELPNLYITSLKFSIENYIKKEIYNSNLLHSWLINCDHIPIILYVDDLVVGNSLGSGYRNVKITNFSYTLAIDAINNRSKLRHYNTFGITKSRFMVKQNYHDGLREIVNRISKTEVTYLHKNIPLKLLFCTGDNELLFSIFGCTKNYRPLGFNNCRICILGGSSWRYYLNTELLLPFYRENHNISFLPNYNNYVVDPFHDLSQGVLRKQMRDNILEYCKLENQLSVLASLLHIDSFSFSNQKYSFIKLSGGQLTKLSFVFFKYLEDCIDSDLIEDNKIKQLKNIRSFIKPLLNMVRISSNPNMHYERAASLFDDSVNHFFIGFVGELGDELNLSTKFHNLLHYGKAMRKLQINAYHFSTKRFESSNLILKKLMVTVSSRINICCTLADKISKRLFLESLIDCDKNQVDMETNNNDTWNYTLYPYEN